MNKYLMYGYNIMNGTKWCKTVIFIGLHALVAEHDCSGQLKHSAAKV